MADHLAVETIGLEKSYGAVRVLTGVDLRVPPGSIFSLLGPNGAGKTTLVRILSTLTRADAGQARVAGFDVARQRRQVRGVISLTGQYAAVDDLQTGAENLVMMGRLGGLSRARARRRARELLESFDLVEAAGRRAGDYSGGMRRRLDLAASLAGNPSIIFLDEPTTGLDLPSRQRMWQIITGLVSDGVTVFLTTQYLEEADLLADRIAVVDGGRIVADDTPSQLKTCFARQRLDITFTTDAGCTDALEVLGGRAVHRDVRHRTVGVATDGTAGHIRAMLDEIDPQRSAVREFTVHSATLDDVFLALTGHAATPGTPAPARAAAPSDAESTHV